MILFGQTASALSNLNYIPQKVCEQWIKLHQQTYQDFHGWSKEIASYALARGWMNNPDGRIRWCHESNSKGSENSTDRIAVNFRIQGMAASISKLGMLKVYHALKNSPCRLLNLIHDELIVEIPGEWEIDEKKSFDLEGNFRPVYIYSNECTKWQTIIQRAMEEAEEFYFSKMSGRTDLKGKTSAELAPYWEH